MAQHEAKPRASQLKLLSQTGPDTLMGKLLRRFWHPVAISANLAPGTARDLRILAENLTLFRGESGTPYLIGGRCAHRCSVLHTGWVQQEQIRCMYHGWRYDGMGRCTEMPAETHANRAHVRIAGYPLHEYCGLLFAYMGELPAPPFDLPRKEAFERPDCVISTHVDPWDCNWFQQIENSVDAVHVSFVHRWGSGSRLGEEVGAAIPQLAYAETSAGIRQTATRPGGNVRVSDWTFPNNNHVLSPPRKGEEWIHTGFWAVPIDDEHTLRVTLWVHPGQESRAELLDAGVIATKQAGDHAAELLVEHRIPAGASAIDALLMQDYVAMRGQGVIVDRERERLGTSDAGIALLRRIFLRELETIRDGAGTKRWTPIEEHVEMPTPVSVP